PWPHITGLALRPRPVKGRKPPTIDLPAGCQWQRVEHHESGRDHVLRELSLEVAAEFPALGGLVRARDDIGRQPLVTRRVFSDDNHSLMPLGVLTKTRLDLRQLHPEPAQLHLVVDPADELDVAVGTITREVAGPVEPRRGLSAEWVRDKFFRGQVGAVQVAARQAVAADVQLTPDPQWDPLGLPGP